MSSSQLSQKFYRNAKLGIVFLLMIAFAIGNANGTFLETLGFQVGAISAGSFSNHSCFHEFEPVEETPSESSGESTTDLEFLDYFASGSRVAKRFRYRRLSSSASASFGLRWDEICCPLASRRSVFEIRIEHDYRNGIGAPLLI